ncbi:MAB_1171c family putative transporter [Streptomyces sp. NPDC056909]|uniref:MAB_1171c family putative transporter n=1 Tax=Streptomyces sp. NPDC056909 TaxID=3345963 RepID=UPI003698A4AC
MIKEWLHSGCLVLCVLGLAVLLSGSPRRFRHDPALVALTGLFALSGLSFLVSLAPVWTGLDGVLGRPNVSALVAHLCVIGLLVCQQLVLTHWGPPEHVRRRTVLYVTAGVVIGLALVVLFAVLTPGASRPSGFTTYYVHTPIYRAYLTLYIAAYTVGEMLVARACWRHARRTGQVWVARGLYTVTVGAVVTLGYSAVRIGGVVAALFGGRADAWDAVAWLCADVGSALTLIGWFVPTVAQAAVAVRERVHYRRLRPLWNALHAVIPTIALEPDVSRATDRRLRVRDIRWHLDRQAVEIRDGQRALRAHLCPGVRRTAETRHRATGLHGADLAAAVTAEQISHALAAVAHRQEPVSESTDYAETHVAVGATQRARGGGGTQRMLGLPVLVKDSIETAGLRRACGTSDLADHIPSRDADTVALLRRDGAVILGKANTPPYCNDIQTSSQFGTTPNPHDHSRTAGGSSGGAAAAVAAGLAPLAIGSDLAGSLRLPAHYCGVFALRPSYGIVPTRGHIPRPPGWATQGDMLTIGPLARSADDLDLALDALVAPSPADAVAWRLELPAPRHRTLREYRIGIWPDDPYCPVDAETRQLLHHVEEFLHRQGAHVDTATRPVGMPASNRLFTELMYATGSAAGPDDRFAAERVQADALTPDDRSAHAVYLRARTTRHRSWLRANEERHQLRERWADYFTRHDILITPAAPTAAIEDQTHLPLAERYLTVDGQRRGYWDQTTWSNLTSHVHLPSATVPLAHTAQGIPLAVQIIGPYLHDRTVTHTAALLHNALRPH